jgi:hypothetical protein
MLLYFIITTAITLGIIFYYIILEPDEISLIPPIFFIYILLGLVPTFVATTDTVIEVVPKSSYMIKKLTPHKSLLLYNLNRKTPSSEYITDSYTLEQIKKGNFHLKKHTHFSMWGLESGASITYYLIPSAEETNK